MASDPAASVANRGWKADRWPGCADFDGGWFAWVHVPVSSANRQAELTMQLWLEPTQFRLDRPPGWAEPRPQRPQ